MKKNPSTLYPLPSTNQGFTLIELIVAIFIFSVILVGILSVSVSVLNAYRKAKVIKSVKESADFALSSIAKDVRMGKVENITSYSDGTIKHHLMIRRNRGGSVCYYLYNTVSGNTFLGIKDDVLDSATSCPNTLASYNKIINLSGSGMDFSADSGFYSCPTDTGDTPASCGGVSGKHRGWVEINLNIVPTGGIGMSTDAINVETIVSSRDYGWGETY